MRRHDGAILLEVVLAVALFVLTASAVLSGLGSALRASERLRLEANAVDLAATVLARLEMRNLPARSVEERRFREPFDGWTWSLSLEPTLTDTLDDGRLGSPPTATKFVPRPLLRAEVVVRHEETRTTHRLAQLVRVITQQRRDDRERPPIDERRKESVRKIFEEAKRYEW